MNFSWLKCFAPFVHVQIGAGLKLKGIPVVYSRSKGHIVIGRNVTIKSSFLSNLIGLYSRSIILARTPDARIIIGDNVGMSGVTIYARDKITIGDGTLIGGNSKILDNDFHPLKVEDRLANDSSKISSAPIHIGNNCFIGCNVIILKGTVLEDGCVVGAGAVVSGKFKANSVIVGNPGKIVRRLG